MDIKSDCVWRNEQQCDKQKIACTCDLEPCSLYEKKSLIKILKKILHLKF
jgi:hypothetical protein